MFNQKARFDHPCTKDCPNRTADCHAKCLKYFSWSIEHKARLAEQAKQKRTDSDVSGFKDWCEIKRRNESHRKSKRR